MESERKEQLIKVGLAALGLAIAGFVFYKLSNRQTVEAVSSDPFRNIIDQRAPQSVKNEQINEWVKEFIEKELLKGEPLKTTESKLLRQEDFQTIQRSMEIYARVLLFEMRIKHQEERQKILESKDLKSYVNLVYAQIQPELQSFIQAQDQINSLAKIDYNIYYATEQEYTNGLQGMRDAVLLSMASPFKSQRGFSKEKAIEMFMECSKLALENVQQDAVIQCIGDKNEIPLIFDALFVDYAFLNYHIHSEEFKSTLQKHNVLSDSNVKAQLEKVTAKLHEINETF
eukprot:403336654